MPPRKTRRSAAAAAEKEAEPAVDVAAAPEPAPSTARPAKRARVSQEDATAPPPSASAEEVAPPPPQVEAPPPPPPVEEVPPPPAELPPPPPPVDELPPPPPSSDILPPSLPPAFNFNAAAAQQQDEPEPEGGAEYWANLADKENGKAALQNGDNLYLDTINRHLLDFDFEKLCSVSLSKTNIYACLVCGKYFQGRGKSSHAYFHSVDIGHRVFLNLSTARFYILPDNYEVQSAALQDIVYLLHPTYADTSIARLDAPDARQSLDLQAQPYLPGFVGLNNIVGSNDYMNVVIQALAHVKPLRDFFLRGGLPSPSSSSSSGGAQNAATQTDVAALGTLASSSELVKRMALLVRKLWNGRAFKAQVSPHEFLQEVDVASSGRFKITKQGDPVEFMGWLLNRLHTDLGGSKKKPTIISHTFQGIVRIESQKVFVRSGIDLDNDDLVDGLDADGRKEGGQEDAAGKAKFNIDREVQEEKSPFFLLALDLPAPPVFQDIIEKNIIPQVPIAALLAKYDGVTFQEARGLIRRYKATRLPPYVVLHFRRFTKNNFVEERNPTIVNFPVTGLDMTPYVDAESSNITQHYNLVCNITHEATPGTVRDNSVYRAQVHTRIDGPRIASLTNTATAATAAQDKGKEKEEKVQERWFAIQDLIVENIEQEMLFLGETYMQVWERKDAPREVELTALRTKKAQEAKAQQKAAAENGAKTVSSSKK